MTDRLQHELKVVTGDGDQLQKYIRVRGDLQKLIERHRERQEHGYADALTRIHTEIGTLALRWREGRAADDR